MDILRKELEGIYKAQHLQSADLDPRLIAEAKKHAETLVNITGGCAVITDASCDRCYVFAERFGSLMGLSCQTGTPQEFNSSDEDEIYGRFHPEDIVEKRMLEYEFFKRINTISPKEKKRYKATCRIRIKDHNGIYRFVDNSTQIIELSPGGYMWLILCRYDLSPEQTSDGSINAAIVNTCNGEINKLSFDNKRRNILTQREKEILLLIREGKPSKLIADQLQISIHTVNRHRQNIIEKLSVGNSVEAVTAATLMKLF